MILKFTYAKIGTTESARKTRKGLFSCCFLFSGNHTEGESEMVREKLLSVTLAVLLAFAAVPTAFAITADQAEAATAYTYTLSRPAVKIKGETRHVPTMRIKALGLVGTCCQGGCKSKAGKATVKKISNTSLTAKIMYYYGYQKGYLGKKNLNGFKLMRALSYSQGNNHVVPLTISEVKSFINAIPSNLTVPNRFECYICDPTNGSQNFAAYKMGKPVKVSLKKTSTVAASTAAGSGYSFKGIEYTVYNSSGKSVGKLTCSASGVTNTLSLDTGTYKVKETATNKWYAMNSEVYSKTLTSGQTWTIAAKDAPNMGKIHIIKKVIGEASGSLAFDFVLTNKAAPSITYKVTTDAQTGEAEINVLEGTYRCDEILPADSDYIDATGVQNVTVASGETVTIERTNKVPSAGLLKVNKTTTDGGSPEGFHFRVTGDLYNQGTIDETSILEAAEPSVSDYDEDSYELGEWSISEQDIRALNKAAADGKTQTISVTLRNKLTAKEPEPVLLRGEEPPAQDGEETEEDSEEDPENPPEEEGSPEEDDSSDIPIEIKLPIQLKDVEYVYDEETPEASGYETDIKKQIKNIEPQTEQEDGYHVSFNRFDWYGAATSYREVQNGKLTDKTETELVTDASGQTEELEAGITWGKFTVTEVMTEEQAARYAQPAAQTKEITPSQKSAVFSFSFSNKAKWTPVTLLKKSEDGNVSGITFRIEGTNAFGETVDTEAVTDEEGKLDFGKLYAGEYVISETDFDAENYSSEHKVEGYDVPAQKIKVTGEETENIEVEFVNSPLGKLYLTKVDKDSQMFLPNGTFALYEGEKQVALFRIVLDANNQAGIDFLEVDPQSGIRADAPELDGLSDDEEDPEGSEDEGDLDTGDEGDSDTGDGNGDAGDGEVIVVEPDNEIDIADEEDEDSKEIDYNFAVIKGLKPGSNYTIREVTAPEGYAASIECPFTFEDGQKIILENAAPSIGTTAQDLDTGMHMSNAAGQVTIIDKVAYENLGPGHTYLMSGVLICAPEDESGSDADENGDKVEILKDAAGREITAERLFIPEESSGTVDMEFTFDASLLDGRKTVAYEELVDPALSEVNGVITSVASHADPDDEGQTIYFPELRTSAVADDTRMKITKADKEVVITDTVKYSNVIAGKTYTITGTLMDKDTEKPVMSGGKKVTVTQTFVAGEGEEIPEGEVKLVSGEVDLQFVFDGTEYVGRSLVAFERLTTEGKLVGEHTDFYDKDQTVDLPAISTTASTNGTDTVSDKVLYKGLIPGETYIVKGILMDKSTGKELVVNGENIVSQAEFVPEKSDGEITVDFDINARELLGKTAVVFETCYLKTPDTGAEIEVISHKNINNKAQTVTFRAPQTGYDWILPLGILLTLLTAGLICTAAGVLRCRRVS